MIYRKLDVYKNAVHFTGKIYKLTKSFPRSELYGISAQLNRAAVSISHNIAEGSSRQSNKERSHYLRISLGSAVEIEAMFDILLEIELCQDQEIKEASIQLYRIRKMLQALIKKHSA
jgi:four helix bundle protein